MEDIRWFEVKEKVYLKNSKWITRIDNDTELLECPFCECRVIKDFYVSSVGNKGFDFCPYCGNELRNEQLTLYE